MAYETGDVRAALTPGIGTVAYTNSFIGATSTQLYDIDERNGAILTLQSPPNAGTLTSIAPITNPPSFVNFSVALGLDIDISHISGTDVAYLIEVSDPDLRPTVTFFGVTIPNPNFGTSSTNLQILNLTDGTVSSRRNVIPANFQTPFNVYDIAVPMPTPLISVRQGINALPNGSTYSGFPATQVGSTSAPVTFTITNASPTDPLTIVGINTTGDFALSGSAPTTVLPGGGSATFDLTFTPTAAGTRTGTVSITNNSPGNSPYVITLNGVGTAPNPLISVSQGATTYANGSTYSGFPTTAQGSTSAPVTFTITNSSTTDALTIGSIITTGDFALNGATPTTVAPGSTATFNLTFAPTAGGTRTGTVSIANNSQTNNPYVINLSGQGTTATLPDLVVSTTQSVQGSYRNVTILGPNPNGTGVATLTGSLTYTGALVVQPGGVLIQNCQPITGAGSFELQAGAAIAICDPAGITPTGNPNGAVQVTGTRTYSPGASYLYNGTVAQVTGAGLPSQVLNLGVQNTATVTLSQAVGIAQVLRLQAGNLVTGGQTLTLLSTSAGTALVDNTGSIGVGGVVVGEAIAQRYITPTNPGLGYRHYSAPTTNTNPASPNSKVADLNTTGFSVEISQGATYNSAADPSQVTINPFPNVYKYNEARVITNVNIGSRDFDRGFEVPGSTLEPLETTRGYTVNIGAAALVDFVGTLNNGPYTAAGLTRGSLPQSGWHLRGNPYPAPLNWSSIVNAGRAVNIENALYVFKSSGQYSGNYTTYVNGQSTNSGTNILPLGQGFLVRTVAGQTGSIAFTNADRLTTFDTTPFQRGTADTRPLLKLALGNATTSTQVAVYFEPGATAGFDRAFDGRTLPAPSGLLLATETPTAEPLAINGQPALTGTDVLIPLQVASATAGAHTLTVDNLTNLPAAYHAYLRDALTGTYTDLATTPSISLTLAANGPAGGRYAILFTTQSRVLATAPAALAQLASVYPNPAHGSATLLLPVALRGTQATQVAVVDNLGRTVLTRTLAAGAAETLELPIGGLAAGIYSVQAHTAAGLVAKRLVVQ